MDCKHKECIEFFEVISEYIDGELDATICRDIERHLEDCSDCRNCLESLRKTINLCKELASEKIPPEIQKRIRNKLYQCIIDKN